jgi:hypothetical protein
MDGALINGNLFDILVAPSCFTIQPVRSEIAMSLYTQKRTFLRAIAISFDHVFGAGDRVGRA